MLCESLAMEYPSAPYAPCQAPWDVVSAATKLATAGGIGITIVVGSLAVAVAEPPPETLTWFTCGEVALEATFTVTVMAG